MNRRNSPETSRPSSQARSAREPSPLMFEGDGEALNAPFAERFPPERIAELGRSGGETADGHVTANDLSPETLLDDDPSHSPSAGEQRGARDGQLRTKASQLGLGRGLDEAEMAAQKPVGHAEAARLKRRSEQHASDARFMEPAGAAEAAQRQRRERRH